MKRPTDMAAAGVSGGPGSTPLGMGGPAEMEGGAGVRWAQAQEARLLLVVLADLALVVQETETPPVGTRWPCARGACAAGHRWMVYRGRDLAQRRGRGHCALRSCRRALRTGHNHRTAVSCGRGVRALRARDLPACPHHACGTRVPPPVV